jgi:hypothetical protein
MFRPDASPKSGHRAGWRRIVQIKKAASRFSYYDLPAFADDHVRKEKMMGDADFARETIQALKVVRQNWTPCAEGLVDAT